MVVDGQWVMSEGEVSRHEADALLALRRAKQNLHLLLTTAKQMSKKLRHVAEVLDEIRPSDNFLRGPAVDLLQLPEMEYGEPQTLTAIKALASSVTKAQRQVTEALQHARELGVAE